MLQWLGSSVISFYKRMNEYFADVCHSLCGFVGGKEIVTCSPMGYL